MNIYGYEKNNDVLIELEETTLQCSLNELDIIIDFLINTRNSHSKLVNKNCMCHSHLKDWGSEWNEENPDLIVVTNKLE